MDTRVQGHRHANVITFYNLSNEKVSSNCHTTYYRKEYNLDTISLVEKLNEIGIPGRYYSINGDLIADTYILNQVHDKWEYFYFDERGNKNDCMIFNNKKEACIHLFKVLETEMKY